MYNTNTAYVAGTYQTYDVCCLTRHPGDTGYILITNYLIIIFI